MCTYHCMHPHAWKKLAFQYLDGYPLYIFHYILYSYFVDLSALQNTRGLWYMHCSVLRNVMHMGQQADCQYSLYILYYIMFNLLNIHPNVIFWPLTSLYAVYRLDFNMCLKIVCRIIAINLNFTNEFLTLTLNHDQNNMIEIENNLIL